MDVKEKAEEKPQTSNVSLSQLETRSVTSASSKSSRSSTASIAATRARAKAEAVRARTTFVEREAEVLLEKAKLESELLSLQHKKEVAATAREAEILEAATAEIESGEIDMAIDTTAYPQETVEKRTKDYVDSLSGSSFHCLPPVKAEPDSRDHEQFMTTPALPTTTATSHVLQDADRLTHMSTPKPYQVSQPRMPSTQLSFPQHLPVNLPYVSFSRNQAYGQVPVSEKSNKPQTPYLSSTTQQPSSSDHTGMTEIARYLVRRELINSGLNKFDDRPENYLAWKSSFINVLEGLSLTPSEELDLLIRWLGPQSSEQVKRVRAVHVADPAGGCRMVWSRLEESFGSAEIIEKTLFDKLDCFPKISNKEPQKLRELADLLKEVESAKLGGFLPGLSFLDTARGVAPIINKLPPNLQEKWMSQGSQYKLQFQVQFPPFTFFADFVCREAYMRNDPSFTFHLSSTAPVKPEISMKRGGPLKSFISTHKTEIAQTTSSTDSPDSKPDINRQCPIHKKTHPLKRCRAFRAKSIKERKMFLKEHNICFRCCSSNDHVAKDCDVSMQCTECGSNKHVTALHSGPPPWMLKVPNAEHGGEKESSNPSINSKCTEVCGGTNSLRSCSKICLIKVHPKGEPDKSLNVYAILDDQSNRSLARPEFFDLFNLKSTEFPYTLRTCAGVSEMSGRRARDFIAYPLDGSLSVSLPTLIECNCMPEDRSEIPTPEAAKHHPHLKSIAHLIPPLDPNAQILLLLGRDILQVHKVREQRNGPQNAPYAQRLDLGWVVVGEVCLGAAHKPSTVSVYRTNILEDGRPSCFNPCPNKLYLKEKLTAQPSVKASVSSACSQPITRLNLRKNER